MPLKFLKLPDELREELRKPLGEVIKDNKRIEKDILVSVGDRTTENLIALNITPKIQIVDGKEQRLKRDLPKGEYKSLLKCINPPGHLSSSSIEAFKRALNLEKPVRILVEGEEDLLTLIAIYFSPINSLIAYGQPKEGMVIVKVNDKIKKIASDYLKKILKEDFKILLDGDNGR
ncbi:hypothetical protein HRbin06_00232 [archaeon HR06]|nr:hypothetical protein HRbin06_00232 [archaeon HR06]